MKNSDLWIVGGVGVAAFVAFYYRGRLSTVPVVGQLPGVKAAPAPALGKALAQKWGRIFNVPVDMVLATMKIESSFRPDAYNPGAKSQGGAWGIMQVTATTAKSQVDRLKNHPNPEVQATLRKYRGQGSDLFDPELGSMLGTYYLARQWTKYSGRAAETFGAYNQGGGNVDKYGVRGLKPEGQKYVEKALKFRSQYA